MQANKGKAREYKVLLATISLLVGLFSFYFIAESAYGILRGLFFGFLVSLLYPVFAVLSVKSIFLLFKFALIWDKNYSWIIESQILVGTFWPITLPFSLVIAFYSSIINRLFREHWTSSPGNPTINASTIHWGGVYSEPHLIIQPMFKMYLSNWYSQEGVVQTGEAIGFGVNY